MTFKSEYARLHTKVEPIWRTINGVEMKISMMDDTHLSNSIKMLERNAKNLTLKEKLKNLSKKEKIQYLRDRKLKRILGEVDYDIIWEPNVVSGYWDLIYEQRKRENILFR